MDIPERNVPPIFLGYDSTFPRACAERLVNAWENGVFGNGEKIPSFTGTVLLLPGSFAIREFCKSLAEKFPGGCLLPELLTPGSFRNLYGMPPAESGIHLATREEALLFWVRTLQQADPREFPHILAGLEDKIFTNYLSLAGKIQEFRSELDQGGLTLEEAIKLDPHRDTERRRELRKLEERYLSAMEKDSLSDPFTVRNEFLHSLPGYIAGLPPEKLPKAIIAAGIADLSSGVKKLLSCWEEYIPLEIWAAGSGEESFLLDSWGCPIAQVWENRPLPMEEEEFPETVFHSESAREMTHLACAVAARHGVFSPAECQFVAAGRELPAILAGKLREMLPASQIYDPAGIPLSSLRISRFLGNFLELCRKNEGNWDKILAFLRSGEILRLGEKLGNSNSNTLLIELDEMLQEHLPDSLENALLFASAPWQAVFRKLQEMLAEFEHSPASFLPELLSGIYSGGNFPGCYNISFQDEYAAFLPLLNEMCDSKLLSSLDGESFLELLLKKTASTTVYPLHNEEAVEILGFLELPSLPQNELLICGMNDGLIPEKMDFSLFLTDSQREALQLSSNKTRRARDNYYLDFAMRYRKNKKGCIRFFASRYSVNSSPVRYSPFLFQGRSEKSILSLTQLLFSPGVTVDKEEKKEGDGSSRVPGIFLPVPPFTPGRNGAPGMKAPQGNEEEFPLILNVTDFRNYLASPLRFCLKKFHSMGQLDYTIKEMDALHYGTLAHNILEKLSLYENQDAGKLCKKAEQLLGYFLEKEYGSPLPLLVETQHDLILQRLEAACRKLAENAKTYKVLETEYTLGGPVDKGGLGYIPWQNARLKGRIDRIEISRDGKRLRLLDYKTQDKGESPKEAHYSERKKEFKDLQLPLYKILLESDPYFRKLHPELDWETLIIQCGYFSLPKDILNTDIQIWETMDEVLQSAKVLLSRILYEIREEMSRGIFAEDPDKKVKPDEFASIFLPELSLAVSGCEFTGKKEG